MAEKIKLNKNTLREQNQLLKLYQEFLPTLELRKQQLQSELSKLQDRLREQDRRWETLIQSGKPIASMLEHNLSWIQPLVVVEEIVVEQGNVAGVRVPVFREVRFAEVGYSLVGTPWFFDHAVQFIRESIVLRQEREVLTQQIARLEHELTKTTQRINLYEKVLIPETRNNIRKIKVYLGDQQTAAVCRAKIAKAKLVAKAAAAAAAATGGVHGHR